MTSLLPVVLAILPWAVVKQHDYVHKSASLGLVAGSEREEGPGAAGVRSESGFGRGDSPGGGILPGQDGLRR